MNGQLTIIHLSASDASRNISKTSIAMTFPKRLMKSVLHITLMKPARIPYLKLSSPFWKARTLKMPSETPYPLTGDSDTLAAITGSIAEAAYGIPDWIKDKAYSYLDEPLKDVLRRWKNYIARG